MLLIRADANKKIGLGHVMRCLTLAEAARKAGIKPVFLLADDGAEELLKEHRQAYHILHTDFADMESELPELFETVSKYVQKENETVPETVFLLDSYQITEHYVQELKGWLTKHNIRLALMEDYGNVPYKADILINYNIYGVDFSYEKNASKALLGCRYMPLRQAFIGQEYEVREQVKQLLITTGGSDSYRIGVQLVSRLLEKLHPEEKFSEKQVPFIHIVCGKFSESREELTEMSRKNPNIFVHTDVKEMWSLMAQCDLAISAAGTTLYELCAIGVPTICFSFADNQILPGTAFAKYTPMCYAGDYEKDKEAMFATILEKTEEICKIHQSDRRKISCKLKTIVDGKGAERIIGELFTAYHNSINLLDINCN